MYSEAKPAPKATSQLPRLLVVDDDQGILNALRRMLRLHYQVTIMLDAQDALASLRSGAPYELVLTDMMMPGLTGKQLYDEATAARRELVDRFFFLSGGAYGSELHDFLRRFPDRCIDKPFDQATLVTKLGEVYARLGASRASSDVTA
ncbi:MAG: response regulator [Polyangia bacterium]